MARAPTVTTTVTPNPNGVGKKSVASGVRKSMPRTVITADMTKDPNLLAKSINDAVEAAMGGTESDRSSPFSAVSIVRQVSMTHGAQVNIPHKLGVPWAYYEIVRAHPGSALAVVTLIETLNVPQGLTKKNNASFIPAIIQIGGGATAIAGSGVYDVLLAAQ